MRDDKNNFRHDSVQDTESIQDTLKSVNKGFAKGKLTRSDEDGEIVMDPVGLLNLRLSVME